MEDSLVVDASVAVKWLIAEQHSDRASALRADSARLERSLFAPPLLPYEVLNVLYQAERRGRITRTEADVGLRRLQALELRLTAPDDLLRRAHEAARQHNLSATYDAQYLALAELLDVGFWTADERLLRSLHPRPAWVHWIGDYGA